MADRDRGAGSEELEPGKKKSADSEVMRFFCPTLRAFCHRIRGQSVFF